MDEKARRKRYAKTYKQGLTTVPNPDDLEEVDYDDPKIKAMDWKEQGEIHDRNETVIQGWEDTATKKRLWVGRTLTDHVGDGNAVYVVIKENAKSVRIKVCRGLGDDWVSRHFGEECTLGKIEALDFMDHGGIFGDGKKKPYPYDIVMK